MKFLHAITLFVTLGLALARDFFTTLGLQASYPLIGAFGLAITTLLIFRGFLPLLAVVILTVMVTMPTEFLLMYRIDHDMLLAGVMTIVLFPWLRKMASDR